MDNVNEPYTGEMFHHIDVDKLPTAASMTPPVMVNEAVANRAEPGIAERRAAAIRYLSYRGDMVKDDFTVTDYMIQRPAEDSPANWDAIFQVCNKWYKENSIVRNIIDLMGDFCVAGVQISSPDPGQQAILRKWFKTVEGYRISERIANMLYRLGNVGVRKMHATATVRNKEEWKKAVADAQARYNVEIKLPEPDYSEKRIPAKYAIINPRQIDMPRPEIAAFLGEPVYYLKMPFGGLDSAMHLGGSGIDSNKYLDKIPKDIQDALKHGKPVLLDNDRFAMFHYKKDDDSKFAYPLIYAALSDLSLYSKMSLADRNVVDSAITRKVFVLLGDAEQNLVLDEQYMEYFAQKIAKAGVGGSSSYIMSPPYLSLVSDDGKLASFLGKAKYEIVLQAIYTGFGIPAALTGDAKGAAANNYMSMKVLVRKLEYVRRLITGFWEEEARKVCYAFSLTAPYYITFSHQELGDEAAMKKLVEGMYDRGVISDESYREQGNFNAQMEDYRIKAEDVEREARERRILTTPLHNGNWENEAKKIAVQQGAYALEEIGVPTHDVSVLRKNKVELGTDQATKLADQGHKLQMKMVEKQSELKIQEQKSAPKPAAPAPTIPPGSTVTTPKAPQDNGRPKNTKDVQKRKEKNPGTMKSK